MSSTDGSWLSPALIRQLACDADIVPVVLGGNSEPLDVGRERYVVPVAIRRALTARDQGCTAPGCGRPSGWCDAHHITHWAHGGETKITNLTLVCSYHHHMTHHDGWDIRIAEDDLPEWIPPPWIDPTRQPRRNARFGLRNRPLAPP